MEITENLSLKSIVLQEYRAVYFWIPKVACTSLKTVFAELLNLETPAYGGVGAVHFADFQILGANDSEDINNYFKFGFIRNPWDRLVSCFTSKIRSQEINNDYFRNGIERSFYRYGDLFYSGMPFSKFVFEICNIEDSDADVHFMSQHQQIPMDDGVNLLDFIGRFESLQDDYSILKSRLGFELSLPHLHRTKTKSYDFFYNRESRDLVSKRYEKDIDLFKYTY
jgi:hypothetical protein